MVLGQPTWADLGLILIERSSLFDKIGILRRLLAWRCRKLSLQFEIQ